MKYILDMVHHNPGEPPFDSRFLDPNHLLDYGYNGQVFKHLNCVATFAATGKDFFPAGSEERRWIDAHTAEIKTAIDLAKSCGVQIFFHLDICVLPRAVVTHYRDEVCDPETGRISFERAKTLELHRILFEELAGRFPEVDGYIIRVGETYLFDTPHHVGNGPIPQSGPEWSPEYLYAETLAEQQVVTPNWNHQQRDVYRKLLRFLREEVCERHNKTMIFRTWDTFPDKLHARLDRYLEVSDAVEPHENLIFSIKHTALDFWRHTKFNECLGQGRHPQVVEVQCQREYEGKGAYPNYVMDGVINGFDENRVKKGLKDIIHDPRIVGVFSWSRGGGWFGPYISNELWPDLNAFVLGRFCQEGNQSEAELFVEYARSRIGLSSADTDRFRALCAHASEGILKGRHCRAFDSLLGESVLPTACWMRDDRLGGYNQLSLVLDTLAEKGSFAEALAEKAEAVQCWERVAELAEAIAWPAGETGEFAKVSAQYGLRLFRVVEQGWRVMLTGYCKEHSLEYCPVDLAEAIARYDQCWAAYQALADHPLCPSLYRGEYFSLPGESAVSGMHDSLNKFRKIL